MSVCLFTVSVCIYLSDTHYLQKVLFGKQGVGGGGGGVSESEWVGYLMHIWKGSFQIYISSSPSSHLFLFLLCISLEKTFCKTIFASLIFITFFMSNV